MVARKKKVAPVGIPPKEREHLEECAANIKAFLEIWSQIYWTFRHAFLGDPVTMEKEIRLLQLKSEIARRHQFLYEQLGEHYIGGEMTTDFLRIVVNLEKISKTQVENYYKIEKKWQLFLLNLNDSMTTIQFRLDQEDQ